MENNLKIKIIINFFVLFFIFALGFFTCYFVLKNKSEYKEKSEVKEAYKYITVYSNRLYTNYKYISVEDTNSRENVINNLNSLLTDSRLALINYNIIKNEYEKLKKVNSRSLYFLFGGFISYDFLYSEKYFNYKSFDFGVSAGFEYKRSSVLISWGVAKNSVALSYLYRF